MNNMMEVGGQGVDYQAIWHRLARELREAMDDTKERVMKDSTIDEIRTHQGMFRAYRGTLDAMKNLFEESRGVPADDNN